ncbi:MAG TPA: RluA family pseudouridine synthase [Candidatus Binatia bacterium]|nr:RluA family pseudouridine synthase [Candidatus Binatia bacterium]
MSTHRMFADSQSVGMRLDLFLARHCSIEGLSRSAIQKLVVEGHVTVNGQKSRSSARLKANDVIEIYTLLSTDFSLSPEALPLDILYEDDDCMVINKPSGMVVHPAAGRTSGTLVNALVYHRPEIARVGSARRPGIVHRLDKDTSGVMIVAKTPFAYQDLVNQFKDRRVSKEYLALVWGQLEKKHGIIDRPVGRHRADRKRMSSIRFVSNAKRAVTEWSVEETYPIATPAKSLSHVTLLRLKPSTGRTHQIRVHLADVGFPLVGDKTYGRKAGTASIATGNIPTLVDFPRQALHAAKLGVTHPRTGGGLEFRAALPQDMESLLNRLKQSAADQKCVGRKPGVDKEIVIS